MFARLAQVRRQVGLHAAFGGVDFQAGENGQRLHLFPGLLALLCLGVLVVGDDAPGQGGVGDLPHTGGESVPHRLEPGAPVFGVLDAGLDGGDFQERQVAQVVQILVLVVFLHTPVDNGVGDGLHHVPVEVRSPQALGGVHGGADHHHVGEVAQVVLAHLLHRPVGVEENFLISGDVGISQQGAGRLALIPGPGRVESVVLKLDGLCDGQKGPLGLGALFGSHIQQRDQKLQQVPGEEPDVPGHLQPAQGVVF